ncbi:SAM-dependent methyltransferase [Streptacidiphilus sp. MAP12-16]|uniref:class I SAM-dependent methyltransferase n=1 Tax=Streptacidiphilus sp. MAP12-16 TaxID=3156300 RepID=UPI0035139244
MPEIKSAPASLADAAPPTAGADYTERLVTLEKAGLKRFVPTQAPYRWNLRRLKLGRVLEVGCGVGRNLHTCSPDSVGVDHNEHSVLTARARGLNAYTGDEFLASSKFTPKSFDSLLVAHVLEHVSVEDGRALLEMYLPYIRTGGSVVFICPQEAGYASDATHIRFLDFPDLRRQAEECGLNVERAYSFPLPRNAGKSFRYNEFVQVAKRS